MSGDILEDEWEVYYMPDHKIRLYRRPDGKYRITLPIPEQKFTFADKPTIRADNGDEIVVSFI